MRVLSANGSNIDPSTVLLLNRLAIYPSNKSVTDATRNDDKASVGRWVMMAYPITGDKQRRVKESEFGIV